MGSILNNHLKSTDGSESNRRQKPDVMIGVVDRKRELYFFYVEVKRPSTSSIYQEENDHVKLLKHLKYSIDKQIDAKIKDPVSYGLLCQGKFINYKIIIYTT